MLTDEQLNRLELVATRALIDKGDSLHVEYVRVMHPDVPLALIAEIRAHRAALTAEDREALAYLRSQQDGLTLAIRRGAAEGECDADGNELPGEWIPTKGGHALRVLDRLLALRSPDEVG
jgi:hypothetical protein